MSDATQRGAEASVDAKIEAMFGDKPKETPDPKAEAIPEGTQDGGTEGGDSGESQQEPEKGADEDTEGPQIELSHFAAALGVDESTLDVTDDGVVIFKAKVDGQELTAKAADVLKGYQLEGTANKRLMEAAEQRKALDQHRQQLEQFAAQRLQQLDDSIKVAHGLLLNEFQSVPWEHLKTTDPNTYTLKRQELADRKAALDQMLANVAAERQQQQQKISEEMGQRQQQEVARLLAAVPEWQDPVKRDAGMKEILSGAAEYYGYSQQDVGSAMDHRLFLMARDAIAYRNLKKSQPAIAKKVRLAPKAAAPGQPKSAPAKEAQIKALRERVRKSGGTDGVEELLRLTGRA